MQARARHRIRFPFVWSAPCPRSSESIGLTFFDYQLATGSRYSFRDRPAHAGNIDGTALEGVFSFRDSSVGASGLPRHRRNVIPSRHDHL